MVDLGQKRWKRFHLFYWNKVKQKENRGITNRLRVYLFFYLNQLCKRQEMIRHKKRIDKSTFQSICLFFFSLIYVSMKNYFSEAYLLETSVQLIVLKKASI
jgi:hypothetical protein